MKLFWAGASWAGAGASLLANVASESGSSTGSGYLGLSFFFAFCPG